MPPNQRKVRICVVGQKTYFDLCALKSETAHLDPSFIDYRAGDNPHRLRDQLIDQNCDLYVFFKPEVVESSSLKDVPGIKVGWFTEPLPRSGTNEPRIYDDPDVPVDAATVRTLEQAATADLERRLEAAHTIDAQLFDKLVVFDPLISPTLSNFLEVWKAIPLPVDDSFFADPQPMNLPPRVTFVGRPTLHRDLMLQRSLHRFDIRYVAHGFFGNDLSDLLQKTDVGISLHNERYPNYENRVSLHLARGHLVISEPLSPLHGLEPGLDFLEIKTGRELYAVLEELFTFPESQEITRQRGRQKAEYFRASTIYESLARDLNLL